MASSIEILYGFIAAVGFTIFDITMWFTGNALFKPIIDMIDRTPMHPMMDFTAIAWILPFNWAILLFAEAAVVGAFIIIGLRRQANEYEYGYY